MTTKDLWVTEVRGEYYVFVDLGNEILGWSLKMIDAAVDKYNKEKRENTEKKGQKNG